MRFIGLLGIFLLLSACTHPVHSGFDRYLAQHPMETDAVSSHAGYTIDEDTEEMTYSFRSAMAGLANTWVVNVGSMLKDYLDTAAVGAFASLKEDPSKNRPFHMHFRANSYKFEGMRAHVDLKISVYKGGSMLFEKDYQAEGRSQTGKMFWGGAAGMRHAVHQSTHYAFNDIMADLIADLKKY